MTTPLHDVLIAKIRAGGPIPFAAYMQLALYHPRHGYYASGKQRTGWGGHFVTSPELDPAFGGLWAAGFQQVWEACDRPSEFHVVEIGPGEGGMVEGLVASIEPPFADALHLDLIERSPEVEERQRAALADFDRARWHRSITELPSHEAGCFFANEVLDNLPVHLVQMEGGELVEVCVTEHEGRLVEVTLPVSNPELSAFVARCAVKVPEGHRFEVHLAAESLIKRAGAALERGAMIFVDYGSTADDLAQRGNGSLVCYSAAGVDEEPLADPGTKDVTIHANWTAVTAALQSTGNAVVGPVGQRTILKNLGLDALHESLREEFRTASAAGDGATALRALSRRQALGALADPNGLGGLEVVAGTRGIETPAFLAPEREQAGS